MIALALRLWASPLARRLLAGCLIILATAAVLVGIYRTGEAAGRAKIAADRDAWRTTAKTYLGAAKAWERSFRDAERLRAQERGRAERAFSDAATACDARVATARRSAAAIQSIVTREVRYDESRCPVRAVVGAGELRDALGLAAGR